MQCAAFRLIRTFDTTCMNGFGQKAVEWFLIRTPENCLFFFFFFTCNNRKSEIKYFKSCWRRISATAKQLTEQLGNGSV